MDQVHPQVGHIRLSVNHSAGYSQRATLHVPRIHIRVHARCYAGIVIASVDVVCGICVQALKWLQNKKKADRKCRLIGKKELAGPFGGRPVEGFFSLSSGPIHADEAERSLNLIYKNFRENKKLLLKKAVVSISRNGTERRATVAH